MNTFCYSNDFQNICKTLPVAYCNLVSAEMTSKPKSLNGKYMLTFIHNHSELEIILITKGSGSFTVNSPSNTFAFGEGDILIVNPFEFHSGYFDTDDYSFTSLDFSASLLNYQHSEMCSELSSSLHSHNILFDNIVRTQDKIYPRLREYLLGIYNGAKDDKSNDFSIVGNIFGFFSCLVSDCRYSEQSVTDVEAHNKMFVRVLNNYLEQHFDEPISTKDVANEFSYTIEYFCRLFKKHFATSFSTYLTKFRINKSVGYLIKYSSIQVSEMCGFTNPSTFAHLFKKYIGISPSEYKKYLSKY